MPPRAPAVQDSGEPLLDAADDERHVVIAGRVLPDETRAQSIGACDEDPVGDQRVGVGVQTRAVRKALDLQETAGRVVESRNKRDVDYVSEMTGIRVFDVPGGTLTCAFERSGDFRGETIGWTWTLETDRSIDELAAGYN